MRLLRGFEPELHGCALSIGNFDGMHLGHQALIARLKQHAVRANVPAVVQFFEPTPREFFAKTAAPGRVSSLRGRLADLRALGIGYAHCLRFGVRLTNWPAERYVEELLVRRLGVKAVLVGDDFRFGAGRGGDIALLKKMGERHGFVAEAIGTVEIDGLRVSSSLLREALAAADLARAEKLLGRPYRLLGRVRHGLRLGRTLGMPTANLHFRRPLALKQGVYAVRVDGRPGVASFGVRPTLGGTRPLLEAHVLDVHENLYGREIGVEFARFLRPEERFDSMDALAAQMKKDAEVARRVFEN